MSEQRCKPLISLIYRLSIAVFEILPNKMASELRSRASRCRCPATTRFEAALGMLGSKLLLPLEQGRPAMSYSSQPA